MRRIANPTLGVLLLLPWLLLSFGCSKNTASQSENPRLEKSGQPLTAEPTAQGTIGAPETGEDGGKQSGRAGESFAAPEPNPAPVLSPAEMADLVRRAKAGDANAQVDLGNIFFEGRGADVNKQAAEYWWNIAARQRHPVAIANLNQLHAKPEEGVSFFGTASRGNKFVFIIDRSGSMSGQRFAAAKEELCRTLGGLKPTDNFMIYFFNSRAEPMPAGMLPGTPEKIKWAIRWVQERTPRGGTDPKQALHWCFNLRPDTVWLLTDGRFSNEGGALDAIAEGNRRLRARINTLAFHDKGGADILQRIARENDGTYRFVNP